MAITMTLCSSKGGIGKTTTALNLAVAWAERGQKTLLIDLDPQGAIGLALAKDDTEWTGLTEFLMESGELDSYLLPTSLPALTLLPRGRLDPVDICEFESYLYSSGRLGELVSEVGNRFDYIVFDTPSGLGMTTRAGLAVCRFALVLLQAEPMALRALVQTLRVIEHVQQNENPELSLLGILPTMVQLGQDTSINVMSAVWSGFGGVLDTCIPRTEAFARASELGLPVGFVGGPVPAEARRFEVLAAELETRITELDGTTGEEDERPQRSFI